MRLSLLLFIIFLNAFAVMAQKVTQESVMQTVSKGKGYTLAFLKKGSKYNTGDKASAEKIQMEHLVYLFTLKEQGKLPFFGPLADDSEIRGICIFNLTDAEEVKKLLDADPHIKAGNLIYELHPWFGIPGDKLPE